MRYPSTAYAFRLNSGPEDARYKAYLDGQIRQQQTSTNDVLRRLLKRWIDAEMGWNVAVEAQPATEVESEASLAEAFETLSGELEERLMQRLTAWLRGRLADQRFVAQVNTTHERLIEGDAVEDDVLANMLEDFGR